MKEITKEDIKWREGFECGIAFVLRHYSRDEANTIDINRLSSDLARLRIWKNHEQWRTLVEKNCKDL